MRLTKSTWLVAASLALAALLCAGLVLPALAQTTSENDVRKLLSENRVAAQLKELNLTPAQLEELKQVLVALRDARDEGRAKLAELLEQRRDALLSGDDAALDEIDKQLREIGQSLQERVAPALEAFKEGLTERQLSVLRSLIGPIDVRLEAGAKGAQDRARFIVRRIAPHLGRRIDKVPAIRSHAGDRRMDMDHPGEIRRGLPAFPALPGARDFAGPRVLAGIGGSLQFGENIDAILSLIERMQQ